MNDLHLPDFDDIEAARERIRGRVEHTPVARNGELDRALGCQALLKCEQLQPTGAFKLRGATNAVARLRELGDDRDVATHSSGNHGAALARAARADGRRAFVVMPRNSVPGKIDAVRANGGEVVLCEPGQMPRERGLASLVADGRVPVPPYDHPDIIAGQGTAALELMEAEGPIDVLVTPVGGGGLLAGSAIASRSLCADARVFGAEPSGAADTHASFRAGERVGEWQPDTVADGLRALVGVSNFAVIRDRVDDILLADDEAIVDAMRLVHRTTGMKIEPSAAVALAVIRQHPASFDGRKVGVIVSGGNYDPALFPWLA